MTLSENIIQNLTEIATEKARNLEMSFIDEWFEGCARFVNTVDLNRIGFLVKMCQWKSKKTARRHATYFLHLFFISNTRDDKEQFAIIDKSQKSNRITKRVQSS